MREWQLGPGDPLALTLAADFRFGSPDFFNDHIWELELGSGDPSALSLHTTYGLRARSMRIFPRFTLGNQVVTAPGDFFLPPRVRNFFPNFLQVDFSPLPGIEVAAEYWIPDSHSAAGRFTVTNRRDETLSLLLELCGHLVPLEGQSLDGVTLQSVNVLAGHSADLAPVIFLTGGPQAGLSAYPCLALDLVLAAGGSRTLAWAEAALANPSDSFELARRMAARPWEAERARIEMVNAAATIEVHTGEPDWDAAFALSQKAALGLFFGPNEHLPCASFVQARQPDHGNSLRGDGSDYPDLWSGQTAWDACYLASLLPGAPELAAGLVRNFLAVQTEDGAVDGKPGLAGQRGRWLATPLLVALAWKTYQRTQDVGFLSEVWPGLSTFFQSWVDKRHDRDGDGFPEWDHSSQTGLEDNPAFTVWQANCQGAELSAAESPALAAMLAGEARSLAGMAEILGLAEARSQWERKSAELGRLAEECWDAEAFLYHNRDRESHRSPVGKLLGSRRGAGTFSPRRSFRQAVRLLVRLETEGELLHRSKVVLHGQNNDSTQTECLEWADFQRGPGLAVATTRNLYRRLDKVEVSGVEKTDTTTVQVMDFSREDVTLFLPLWAGIPDPQRAQALVMQTLFAPERFGWPFGAPACAFAVSADLSRDDWTCQSVHLPWNTLIGMGLLGYGLREEAAYLVGCLMAGVVQNLRRQRAFYRAYHAENGTGLGERNPVQGLAPLGLFLATLGVEIQSPRRVVLKGKNPFPWPVTVKYRGLMVTRQAEQTVIVFPDGQTAVLNDPTEATVSVD